MSQETIAFLLASLCVIIGVTGGGLLIFRVMLGRNSEWRYDKPPEDSDDHFPRL